MSVVDPQIQEGASGFVELIFNVTLSQEVDTDVSVDFATVDGSARVDRSDYVAANGRLVFRAGPPVTQVFAVRINGDEIVERDEVFQVLLTNLMAGISERPVRLERTTANGTIRGDDFAVLSIAATGADEGGSDGEFTLTSSHVLQDDLAVTLLVGGTATAGEDYVALPAQLQILGGTRGISAPLRTLNDRLVERGESVVATLQGTDSSFVTVGTTASTQAVINDNDTATLSVESIRVDPADGPRPVLVRLVTSDGAGGTATLAPGVQITANVVDAGGGTGRSAIDYAPFTPTSISFVAGDGNGATRSVLFTPILNPAAAEDRTVNLRLQNLGAPEGVRATIGNASAVVTISGDPETAQLRGLVFLDGDDNGIRSGDRELGIPGVMVRLRGVTRRGETVELVAMTDDQGAFAFQGLPAGIYELIESSPIAFMDGRDSAGTAGGFVLDDRLRDITIDPAEVATEYLFGEMGFKAEFVSVRLLLSSSQLTSRDLRLMVARGAERMGLGHDAQQIRDAAIPSTVRRANSVPPTARSTSSEGIVAGTVAPTGIALLNAPDPEGFAAPIHAEPIHEFANVASDEPRSSQVAQSSAAPAAARKTHTENDTGGTKSTSLARTLASSRLPAPDRAKVNHAAVSAKTSLQRSRAVATNLQSKSLGVTNKSIVKDQSSERIMTQPLDISHVDYYFSRADLDSWDENHSTNLLKRIDITSVY
jgi:hypothetical protein